MHVLWLELKQPPWGKDKEHFIMNQSSHLLQATRTVSSNYLTVIRAGKLQPSCQLCVPMPLRHQELCGDPSQGILLCPCSPICPRHGMEHLELHIYKDCSSRRWSNLISHSCDKRKHFYYNQHFLKEWMEYKRKGNVLYMVMVSIVL